MANAYLIRPYNISAFTADSESGVRYAANLNDDFKGHYWVSSSGTPWVQADLGTSQPVDFASILAAYPLGGSQTMNIRVRGSNSVTTTTSPTYDSGVVAAWTAGTKPNWYQRFNTWSDIPLQSLRYWRFDLSGDGSSTFAASRLVIGQKLQTACNYVFGSSVGTKWTGQASHTDTGVIFYRPGVMLRTVTLSFEATTDDELWSKVMPFFSAAPTSQNHLLVCLDPTSSVYRQDRMFFGFPTSDFGAVRRTLNGYEWKVTIEGRL